MHVAPIWHNACTEHNQAGLRPEASIFAFTVLKLIRDFPAGAVHDSSCNTDVLTRTLVSTTRVAGNIRKASVGNLMILVKLSRLSEFPDRRAICVCIFAVIVSVPLIAQVNVLTYQ